MSIGQNLVSASSPYSTPQLTPMATPNGQAPPPKNPKLYKTELCRSWMDHGRCNYGERCQYAHGELEKRPVPRHPKYKTEACQSFHQSGYCPYGPRCHFIHKWVLQQFFPRYPTWFENLHILLIEIFIILINFQWTSKCSESVFNTDLHSSTTSNYTFSLCVTVS